MLCNSISRAVRKINETRENVRCSGWCVVRELLNSEDVSQIRQLIESERHLFTVDRIAQNNYFGGARLYALNLRALKPLHQQLGLWMSEVMDRSVQPSYSFALINTQDYVLRPHRDQAACKYTVNISIAKTCPSPIFMEGEPVELEPGDSIVYLGCETTHWRDILRGPNEITNVVFHYVDQEPPG